MTQATNVIPATISIPSATLPTKVCRMTFPYVYPAKISAPSTICATENPMFLLIPPKFRLCPKKWRKERIPLFWITKSENKQRRLCFGKNFPFLEHVTQNKWDRNRVGQCAIPLCRRATVTLQNRIQRRRIQRRIIPRVILQQVGGKTATKAKKQQTRQLFHHHLKRNSRKVCLDNPRSTFTNACRTCQNVDVPTAIALRLARICRIRLFSHSTFEKIKNFGKLNTGYEGYKDAKGVVGYSKSQQRAYGWELSRARIGCTVKSSIPKGADESLPAPPK